MSLRLIQFMVLEETSTLTIPHMSLPVVFSSSPTSGSSCKYFTTNLYLWSMSHLTLYIYCYLSLLILHKFRLSIVTLAVLFSMHVSSTWKKNGRIGVPQRNAKRAKSCSVFFSHMNLSSINQLNWLCQVHWS